MKIYEKMPSPLVLEARQFMAHLGLVAMTFVQRPWTAQQKDFTVYVNREETVCVERAGIDLLTWHKATEACGFSSETLKRLVPLVDPGLLETCYNILGRVTPAWHDTTDLHAVFGHCLANGYVYASEETTRDALAAWRLNHPE